jgi:hypothetical protein
MNRAQPNSGNKKGLQKFKKQPPTPNYTALAAANKGKLLHKINKNNVIFTQNASKVMPVSQLEHQSLLEKEIRMVINKSRDQEVFIRKNNRSSGQNFQSSVKK